MTREHAWTLVGALALLFAACGPAATPTPTPAKATPTSGALATATAQQPPPGGSVTPQPSPTTPPTAVAAATKPKTGGTLRTYLRSDITWDPHRIARHTQGRQVQGLVFSQLGQRSWPETCGYQIIPDAAKSWRWLDDTNLEVQLTPAIKFHNKPPVNGRELVADDVVFSLLRLKGGAAFASGFMDKVKAVTAQDRYTVKVSTTGPHPAFITNVLASIWGSFILAKEAGGPEDSYAFPEKSYIGTGPFQFASSFRGVKVSLEKNPGYFKPGVPYVQAADFYVMPDMGTRVAALHGGKLDFLTELPPTYAAEIYKTRPSISIKECPSMEGTGTVFGRWDLPPLNDVRVRRALAMALDRRALIATAMVGKGEDWGPFESWMPYALPWKDFPPEVRKWAEYNPAEAKKLLAEAGYPNGLELDFVSTRAHGSPYNELYEAAIAMLQAVGIRFRQIEWMEYARSLQTISVGNIPAGTIAAYRRALLDPFEALPQFHSQTQTALNRFHVRDPEMDKLIDALNAAMDEKKAADLARQIQIRMVDQAYWIRLPNTFWFAAYQPWVKDFGGSGDYNFFKPLFEKVWLDR